MKVKICGVTHPEDALHAACCGADYIGIIFAKNSKRKVSILQAKAISQAARRGGAEPVGVFVDELLEEIVSACEESDINIVQLHGRGAQASLPQLLLTFTIIYALSFNEVYSFPKHVTLLVDSSNPGSGEGFDWKTFSPPQNIPWMLAGGLKPDNVAEAIRILQPHGVDVASGVEMQRSVRKDPFLVEDFIEKATKGRENL